MALEKAKSDALAFSTGADDRKLKRTEKVLDEEDYVEAMGKIIERDFFPDLERYRAHNDYLDAVREGDIVKIRDVSERLRRVSKTPGMTSERVADQTPTPAHSNPMKRGRHHRDDTLQDGTPAEHVATDNRAGAGGESSDVDALIRKKNGEDLSLDEFAARNTSEDNASFRDIMEVGLDKKRQRYAWLYEKEALAAEAVRHQSTLAITSGAATASGENSRDEDRKPIEMDSWTYTPKNSLMYVPEGIEKSASEQIEESKKEKKMVVYGNTRLARAIRVHQDMTATGAVNRAAEDAVRREQFGVDGNELGGDKSPAVNGYGFVATPSMTPGVDASPLMTWGTIDGTPFRIDTSDLVPDATPGAPNFQISTQPKREALGHKLAEKVGQQHRAKKKLALQTASKSFGGKTPGSSIRTADRISALSPAARRLVSSGRVLRSTHSSLRSTYTPRASRTPGSPWIRSTPGTPKPSPVRSSPRRRSAGLTDNLLKLS